MKQRLFQNGLLRLAAACLLILLLASCSGARMREKIRIEGIERVRPQGFSHLLLVLRTANDSGHNLKIKELSLDFYRPSAVAPTLTATLMDPVVLHGRTVESLPTKWRLEYADMLAWMPLLQALSQGNFNGWRVSLRIRGRCGLAPINISSEALPLSAILRTFGIDTENLEKFVNP